MYPNIDRISTFCAPSLSPPVNPARARVCAQTLVGLPDLVALQALVERLKAVGEVLDVGLTQAGDLFLRVITAFVSIGTQFRHLRVLGIRGGPSHTSPAGITCSCGEVTDKAWTKGGLE